MKQTIETVCVYCGSSSNIDPDFFTETERMGQLIAQEGWGLVYGGGRVGLMGTVADATLNAGGEVTGIIPWHIQQREIEHTDLTSLHVVDTMHERKQMMVDKSDAFIILPGGLGTMDETFEILTWKQLGLHDKPVVIVNLKGYWTPFVQLIENMSKEGLIRKDDKNLFHVVDNVTDVAETIHTAPRERFDPTTKWI